MKIDDEPTKDIVNSKQYVLLGRAKGEALNNIFSLLKQIIKSCNAKWWRQQEQWKNNNGFNKQKRNFACAAHFFLYISLLLF